MERLGLQRAAHFSWQRTAELTLDVFRGVLEGVHRRTAHTEAAGVRPSK